MKTKQCTYCKKTKPISEFAKDRRTSDGMQYKCRECSRLLSAINYKKKKEQRKAACYQRREKHPKQHAAQIITSSAIKCMELVNPNKCEACGVECKPQAHHCDYSRPLDVMWLCRFCHSDWHANNEVKGKEGEPMPWKINGLIDFSSIRKNGI